MTDHELKHLNRKELLEMLLEQGQEIVRLKEQLKAAEAEATVRTQKIKQVGSIAEASLAINRVFESAQAAADQYLEYIQETNARCESVRAEAEQQASKIIKEAEQRAAETEQAAKEAADRYWEEFTQKLTHFTVSAPDDFSDP